jgi:hypothetical protein
MYTLLELQSKTFGELKKIGYELNVLPAGDRRRRQSWIEAIVGVNPPLLQLLEVSPGVEVDRVQEPIEVQVQEPPIESKFGRIVYPGAQRLIDLAANAKISPSIDSQESIKLGDWVKVTKKPRLAAGVKRGEILQVLRVNSNGVLVIENPHENPDYILSARLGFLNPSEVCLVPRSDRLDTPAFIDVVRRNFPDRLQELLQNPSGVEPVQEPIMEKVETSTGIDVDPVQERIKEGFNISDLWTLDQPDCPACGGIYSLSANWSKEYVFGFWIISCLKCDASCTCSIEELPRCFRDEDDEEDAKSENSLGVEVDQLPECVECFGDGYSEDESGLVKFCQCSASAPKLSSKMTQRAIVPASKNLPGSRSNTTAHQLLELFKSSAHIIEDSPGVKSEATSESAIAPAAKNHLEEESDQNPILTGIPLSDRFVTRYTPPQPEIIHFQSDADGQLSLLNFEVESVEEPPDPDDFESLDAFREAIERWDREHPSSFDHCSDHLPSSAQNEPPNPEDFDSMFAFWAAYDTWDKLSDDDSEPSSVQNEPSSVQNEPLEVSLDSFCEWAPCPAAWYEPDTSLEQSKVSELLRAEESSITSDFFIPTFDRWGDRKSDEPPDTGIFAKLPGPKPPKFPPRASQPKSGQVSPSQGKSANGSETIPKLFFGIAAGSSTQPARSPPGGDASL